MEIEMKKEKEKEKEKGRKNTSAAYSKHFLFITLPFNLLFLASLNLCFYLSTSISFWMAGLGFFLFSGLGVAIGFHRLVSHKSFKCSGFWKGTLSTLGCMAGQGSPTFWKALHMGLHHPHSDKELDVHSPRKGKWSSFIGWQISADPKNFPFLAARDLLNDPVQIFLHRNYLFIFWIPILVSLLIDFRIAFSFLILPIFLSMHAENVVNLICHSRRCGYRNFETADDSVNVPILGYLFFGQGWHNNHHQFPRDYNFGGRRKYEFDICAWIVPLIAQREERKVHVH